MNRRAVNGHLPRRLRHAIEASRTRLLRECTDAPDVTFIPLVGNRGDELIWAGVRSLLRDVDHREVPWKAVSDTGGSLALVAGSGGWCKDFHGLAHDVLLQAVERFERVVLLPSTFDPTYEPVAAALRATPARIWARDELSKGLMESVRPVEVAHDTAFFFDYGPWVRRGTGTLYAMRNDRSRVADWDALGIDPIRNDDISHTMKHLDQWLWHIAKHAVVHTDRAHVMIAAAMMGKSVVWYSTNDHKVGGIAAYGTDGLDLRPGLPRP